MANLSEMENREPINLGFKLMLVMFLFLLALSIIPAQASIPRAACTNQGQFVSSKSNPNTGLLDVDQRYERVLRFHNTGTCVWNSDYRLVQVSGPNTPGEKSARIQGLVRNGGVVDVWVPLFAPAQAGLYETAWQLQSPDGNVITQKSFNFEVKDGSGTDLSRHPLNVTVAEPGSGVVGRSNPSLPGAVSPPSCRDGYEFISDVTIPDGTRLEPGERFKKIWRYRNSGTCTWGDGYQVSLFSGHLMGSPLVFGLPHVVRPGETVDIAVELIAPSVPGRYKTRFHLNAPGGDALTISARPFVEIVVVD